MFKPLNVINCENEKRFFNSQGRDYCKICPERYKKLTSNRRCSCFIEGTTSMMTNEYTPKGNYIFINMYCIIEKDQSNTPWYEPERRIAHSISINDLRDIYEVHE